MCVITFPDGEHCDYACSVTTYSLFSIDLEGHNHKEMDREGWPGVVLAVHS